MWWAAIDTAEDGDLTQAIAMTDFDKVTMMKAGCTYLPCMIRGLVPVVVLHSAHSGSFAAFLVVGVCPRKTLCLSLSTPHLGKLTASFRASIRTPQRFPTLTQCCFRIRTRTRLPRLPCLQLRQYRRFGNAACLSFGVHIYDEGSVLSIVVDAGAHGTHVAGTVLLQPHLCVYSFFFPTWRNGRVNLRQAHILTSAFSMAV